jgi:hypothetical protein
MEKTAGQRKEKSRRHPTAAVHRRAASSGGGRVNVAMGRELFGDWIGSPPESPFRATREAVTSVSCVYIQVYTLVFQIVSASTCLAHFCFFNQGDNFFGILPFKWDGLED